MPAAWIDYTAGGLPFAHDDGIALEGDVENAIEFRGLYRTFDKSFVTHSLQPHAGDLVEGDNGDDDDGNVLGGWMLAQNIEEFEAISGDK